MSESMPHATEVGASPPEPWDPFQLMDRLDEEALRKEMDGVAVTDLVYVVKEGGQEVVGLSKTGVDECCMALVAQGQVIREEDLQYEVIGEDEEREALFKVKAARFAVSPAGQEVRLDQVIGVKRQPLYFDPAQLDLDARVPVQEIQGPDLSRAARQRRTAATISAGWRRTSASPPSAISCAGFSRAKKSPPSAGRQ